MPELPESTGPQQSKSVPVGNIIPPELGIVSMFRNPQTRAKATILTLSGAFLLSLFLWCLNEFTSIRGLTSVLISRFLLVAMLAIGILLIALTRVVLGLAGKWRGIFSWSATIALMCGLIALDRIAPRPTEPPPLTEADLLKVNVSANLGTPPKDAIGSIKWQPEYTYIDLRLTDPGANDFDDLDITIRFDISLAAMEQVSKFPGVTTFPEVPIQLGAGKITATYKSGETVTIPLYSTGTSSSDIYRIRCEHIPKRATVRFAAAGVVLNIPNGWSAWKPNKEYGPKRVPTVLTTSGSYKTGSRTVTFVNQELKLRPLQ